MTESSPPTDPRGLSRRRFVQGLAAGAAVATLSPQLGRAALNSAAARAGRYGLPELSGTRFDLVIGPARVDITAAGTPATLINGLLPGPLLRWREGDMLTLRVTNRLSTSASMHWHGIIVPTGMDGVPGISYAGIAPGQTFVYRFPVRQSGTFWYHSHTRFQLQTGAAGPLVIEPREPDPVNADRDYVVMLSDWSDEDPEQIFYHLKTAGDYYNYHRRTIADFFHDASTRGLGATLADRSAWGRMRMDPRDLRDVSGAQTGGTYTFLVNGQPPAANWTALFKPGERVRLRFINGSSMSYFDVRIPGLVMTVVAADGSNVEPVSVEELRIGVAETYDVIVVPRADAYTIFAQAMDRSGYARASLAVRPGLAAPIPSMDPIYSRTMVDMGMSMHGMASMAGMAGMPKEAGMPQMPGMAGMAGMRQGMSRPAPAMSPRARPNASGQIAYPQPQQVHLRLGPAVAHIAQHPTERLDRPGDGLNGNGRRVLTYDALVRRADGPQNGGFVTRDPDAEVLLHLTGNMERYILGFNGQTYDQSEPVRFPYGQRIMVTLINDTMMEHPIHLHGLFTELDNHRGRLRPLKHTISVKPGEKLHYFVNATEIGRWAYHCHLLYHMAAGMFTSAVIA
ncbi:MAG TPA: copper resistance system multicopper oxidase [Steroidobacteraceae bacterium]|jgi:CopA family copper-resistance protein|nr:copper resistance system multicopper oxidase [Steroidobacteraceae bacterium]